MKKFIFFLLAVTFLGQMSFAGQIDTAKLNRYFDTLAAHHVFMGSVALSQNGKIIYTRSVGYVDVARKIKANKFSKYRIGSISKTFTAALVLKALEEGKLSLDQTIDKYFPQLGKAGQVTILQLLRQISGIHNFTNNPDYLDWHTEHKSRAQMLDIIKKGGMDFESGMKYEYSNSNYVLLSYILEDVYQMPYAAILKKYITQPLGLKDTYLEGKIQTKNNECYSYRNFGKWVLQTETDASVSLGAGGIAATPSDLVTFINAIFHGDLLKNGCVAMMKSYSKEHYGMGFVQSPFYDKTGYLHTGGIDGFTSVFGYIPDGDVALAITSNGSSYNNNDISIALLSAVYQKPYTIPDFTAQKNIKQDLDSLLGVYSSKQIPIKITISKNGKQLMAQATGQSAFPLTATAKNKFVFHPAGIVIIFNPEKYSFELQQGGGEFEFTKEESK